MESTLTIFPNGDKCWFNEKGKNHRLDGPAVEWPDGYKAWWVEDKRHRLNGPTRVWPVGYTEWHINLSILYVSVMDNA